MRLHKRLFWAVIVAVWLPAAVPAGGEERTAAGKLADSPYFTGMPGYTVYETEDKEFDAWSFFAGKGCTTVEGRRLRRAYIANEGVRPASELQVVRNYANAIKAKGGAILFDGQADNGCAENSGYRMLVGKFVKGADELWAEIVSWGDGNEYSIMIVAKEAMKQEVTAGDLLEALNREGRVTLYINFDTGKATIRPDSLPLIAQVAEMLGAQPELRLGVEGHTDSVGSLASNKTLSENRAKAVVAALAAKGVNAARLAPAGWGQERPVADNATEEGRAKNRRVELVRK